MQKNLALIAAIILLGLAVYGFFHVKSQPFTSSPEVTMVKHDGDKMMKDGDAMMKKGESDTSTEVMAKEETSTDVVVKEEDVMEKKEDEGAMEKTEDAMTKDIVQEIDLKSVDSRGGDAQAARIWKDGKFTHFVTVNNIDPAEGKFFEGWLTTSSAFISTGKMEKDAEGMWRLTYESNEDKLMYNRVVITEETLADGLDNKPETHIFEGSF